MAEKTVTLKDIASACGVTPTVVSAVLNRRKGRISCSPERKKLILDTAEKMNYKVNFFARSIKLKHVPIVGLLLHLDKEESKAGVGTFIYSCLIDMTFAFNTHKLEVVFIPYSTEEEQMERLQNLAGNGLLGGVVTNIIPNSHKKLCEYLKKSSLPYMILGFPLVKDVYCAYPVSPKLDRTIMDIAASRGFSRCVQASLENGIPQFREYPFVRGYMWHTTPSGADFELGETAKTFYSITGANVLSALRQFGFPLEHFILMETETLMPLVPRGTEVLMVPDNSEVNFISGYTVDSVFNWLEKRVMPPSMTFTTDDSGVEYTLIPRKRSM